MYQAGALVRSRREIHRKSHAMGCKWYPVSTARVAYKPQKKERKKEKTRKWVPRPGPARIRSTKLVESNSMHQQGGCKAPRPHSGLVWHCNRCQHAMLIRSARSRSDRCGLWTVGAGWLFRRIRALIQRQCFINPMGYTFLCLDFETTRIMGLY